MISRGNTPDQSDENAVAKLIGDVDRQSLRPPHDLARRVVLRRAVLITVIMLVGLSSIGVGFALSQRFVERRNDLVVAAPPPSDSAEENGAPTPTTEKYEIATGQMGTLPWSLFAYRAVNRGARAEEAGIAGKESLCLSASFGPQRGPLATCFVGLQEPFKPGDYLTVQMALPPNDEQGTVVYGTVAPDVARVEVRLSGGHFDAPIVAAPPGLALPNSFFSAVIPAFEDGSIAGFAKSGETLVTRELDQPARLTVTKRGDGSGTIYGYASEELRCTSCGAPERRWINCGDICEATLHEAAITLVAVPEEGSTFDGWGGSCSGFTCELHVTENSGVTATFSRIP